MNDQEPTGPTSLHRDGEIETFEGDAVEEALEEGWITAREASKRASDKKDTIEKLGISKKVSKKNLNQ